MGHYQNLQRRRNVTDGKIRALEAEIAEIKRQLAAIGDLRPGTLSEQYNVCGNPKCRCKADPPRKHGPY